MPASTEYEELSLEGDWSIGEQAFAMIISRLRELKPKTVVEFGSGPSSIRLAMELDETEIISFEHDEPYQAGVARMLEKHRVRNLRILRTPLRWVCVDGMLFESYAISQGQMPRYVDAAIVDGPPYNFYLGREASLRRAYRLLRIGGNIFLDDYNRETEKQAVRNLLSTYPTSLLSEELDVGHGICVLKKTGEERPRISPRHIARNYASAARRWLLTASRRKSLQNSAARRSFTCATYSPHHG